MTKRILAISITVYVLVFLAGCDPSYESRPSIVGRDPRLFPTVPSPVIITPSTPVPKYVGKYPREWYPPKSVEKKWRAIIIHHTATSSGSMSMIDNVHKSKGWDGVGYDFVIGNGHGSRDGQIEVTYRWKKQVTGAHCKATNNWANEDAIGICLVGDFSRTRPGSRQMSSLVALVDFLQKRYGISDARIYGHNETPNHTTATLCPGKYFPWSTFHSMLAAADRSTSTAYSTVNAK